ncbi:NAD(P)-dependent oxidoreductase [Salinarimonas sp.]|uniref:NAD(P)-dependent oxidoreductase n=1 Tax=Salinarimonas sp. TaxID=2766526 RepID=UPI00391B4DF8
MKVLVLGASGRTGGHVVEALAAAGHEVGSFGRSPPKVAGASNHVAGDPGDAQALARALGDAQAILSCLASSNTEPVASSAARAAIAAADGRPMRYLTIAGAGVDAPGDAKGVADKAVGLVMRLVVGRMLADRQSELSILSASPLAFTMLRPPRLTSGAPTGRWRFTFDRPAAMAIDRADLAAAMVEALDRADFARRAPFVSA